MKNSLLIFLILTVFSGIYGTEIKDFKYDIFRDVRNKNQRECDKFMTLICNSLNKWIPSAWCTFPFYHNQSGKRIGKFSFHMRIVDGFNTKEKTVIYTDSRGHGHEKKYMNLNDAAAIICCCKSHRNKEKKCLLV